MSNTEVTFRDFAAAVMQGDVSRAGGHLEALLDLDAATAASAAGHFKTRMDDAGHPTRLPG